MLDSVVDQRLQQKVRDLGIERLRSDVEAYLEPVLETYLLDLEVTIHKFNFAAEDRDLGARILQAHAEQITQARHHAIGGVNVGQHQRGNRMHRIEEKMGLQLALQGLESSFCQLCFQQGSAQFACAEAPVV